MKRGIDDPHGFTERVRPLYDELFQTAYALTGNLELSEYVLRSALLEAFLRRNEWRERMSFHEGLLYALRAVALAELRRIRSVGAFELDWALADPPELSGGERALMGRLQKESPRTLRMLILTYGCALKPAHAGQALSMSAAGVREVQRRLTSRLQRSFGLSRREVDARLESLCDRILTSAHPDAPAAGALLRAFERDAQGQYGRRAPVGRVLGVAVLVAGALLCALLFWLLTVLLEPRAVSPAPAATQNASISSTNAG